MSPKYHNLEIALIYFLLLIPWPHTNVIKMLCSRDNSRLVRKIVRSKWTPILDKYQVKLPLECPLHPFRDLFAPRQDAKKRDRPTQWTCRLCGKSFYQEKFLDLHFETRHKTIINEAEDSVCLADFCDVMRCEVFQTEESSSLKFGDQHTITDIEVWGDSLGQNSALAKANAAYLSLIPLRTSMSGATRAAKVQNRQLIQDKASQSSEQTDTDPDKPSTTKTKSKQVNESFLKKLRKGVISSGKRLAQTPATTNEETVRRESLLNQSEGEIITEQDNTTAKEQSKSDNNNNNNANNNNNNNGGHNNNNNNNNNISSNAQKARANCKAEELSKLKSRCDLLLRRCIGSLLLSMTDQSFKEMEEEMNKAVCWYLTCDRYWEDGPLEPRAFPWGLIVILIFVLSTGICFCYYIIWILFDSEETTISVNHQLGIGASGSGYMQHQHSQQYQPDYLTGSSGVGVVGGIHGPIMGQHQTQQQQQQQQAAAAYYYQQQHDLYPEPLQYDYHRHSPRHYIADQRPPAQGTPTVSAVTSASTTGVNLGVGVGMAGMVHQQHSNTNTPLHHQRHPTNLAYQQDILDLRDYTSSRPNTTTAVTSSRVGPNVSGPSIATTATVLHTSSSMPVETALSGGNAAGGVVGAGRHYNTHPRPLESRRHVGASQQSLRASTSTHEIIQNEVGQNEQYIYVTYPPDLKKRYFEKYE